MPRGRAQPVAPCDNFFFRHGTGELKAFRQGTLKDLPFDGKLPVLFVDGHVETAGPSDYVARKLYLAPIARVP